MVYHSAGSKWALYFCVNVWRIVALLIYQNLTDHGVTGALPTTCILTFAKI